MSRKLPSLLSLIVAITFGACLLFVNGADAITAGTTSLISEKYSGTWSNGLSRTKTSHAASSDGRYIVFTSDATNLVASDLNALSDVFVRDTLNNTTTLASVSSSGVQADKAADWASISHAGRYVVFTSQASNLVSGVSTTNVHHVYIRDLINNTTTIADTSPGGTAGDRSAGTAKISADGRFVVFSSYSSNLVSGFTPLSYGMQIFLKDMRTGAVRALSANSTGGPGSGDSSLPDISCDGNVVAFSTQARDLAGIGSVQGSQTKGDLILAEIGWSSVDLSHPASIANSTSGVYSASGSAVQLTCNGNIAMFISGGTDLVAGGTATGYRNAYQYNRLTGDTVLVSLGNGSVQANSPQLSQALDASMSDDGRYVVFSSYATNVDPAYPSMTGYSGSTSDVYVRDVKKSTTNIMTIMAASGYKAGWSAVTPSITPDGSRVVYSYSTPNTSNAYRSLILGLTTGSSVGMQDVYMTATGL